MRSFCDGRDRVEVDGKNLRQVFDALDTVCPGIKSRLLSEDDIHPGIAVAVNDLFTSSGLLEEVPEGGTVHILPAMGGG